MIAWESLQPYRVDASWDQYEKLGSASDSALFSDRVIIRSDTVLERTSIDVLDQLELAPEHRASLKMRADHPQKVDAWYRTKRPSRGNSSLYLFENTLVENFVGKPVELEVEYVISSDSSMVASSHVLTIDVGRLLIGSVLLIPTRWMDRSSYMFRATAVFGGILASAVQGAYMLDVTWSVDFDKIVSTAYDGFSVFVSVRLRGVGFSQFAQLGS